MQAFAALTKLDATLHETLDNWLEGSDMFRWSLVTSKTASTSFCMSLALLHWYNLRPKDLKTRNHQKPFKNVINHHSKTIQEPSKNLGKNHGKNHQKPLGPSSHLGVRSTRQTRAGTPTALRQSLIRPCRTMP